MCLQQIYEEKTIQAKMNDCLKVLNKFIQVVHALTGQWYPRAQVGHLCLFPKNIHCFCQLQQLCASTHMRSELFSAMSNKKVWRN